MQGQGSSPAGAGLLGRHEPSCDQATNGEPGGATARTARSELDALGDLLGARCVDAGELENAVIQGCDLAADLEQQRLQLARAEQEVRRLEGRQKLLQPKAAAAPGGSAGDGLELQRLAKELVEAQAESKKLRSQVQELEQRSKEQQAASREQCKVLAAPKPNLGLTPVRAPAAAAPSPALATPTSTPMRWGRLKAAGPAAAPLVFDDDDSDEEPQPAPGGAQASTPSSEAKAGPAGPASPPARGSTAGGARIVNGVLIRPARAEEDGEPARAASSPPAAAAEPGQRLTQSPAAGFSAREYLSRLQVSKTAKPSPSNSLARQLALARTVFRSAAPKVPAKSNDGAGKAPAAGQASSAETPAAGASAASDATPGQSRPAAGEEMEVDGDGEERQAKRALVDGGGVNGKGYNIDVRQLVPHQNINKWKEAHPTEWKALVEQGEKVSPHQNLLKVLPWAKRPRRESKSDEPGEKKVRRNDDTSDRTFERRQAQWSRTAREPAAALVPKQQVDHDGVPRGPKAEDQPEAKGADFGHADPEIGGRLADDVHVAEGLRCPRWLWEALYPYQHTCVHWLWGLHREKLGGILADEMGLGKTVQIVAYLAVLHHSGVLQTMRVQNASLGCASAATSGGILIVAPATLIGQWRNELHLWYPPLRVCIMHQVDEPARKEAIRVASTEQGILITSYETMRIAHDELMEASWVMIILDEGQKIRNPHANITLAAKRFSTPHRIILSGSPIQNNLQELWSLFDFICPGRLGTLPVFLEEFARPIQQGNLVGASQTRVAAAYQVAMALRELTQPCILRRTKAECMDVLKLPHKQEQVLFCHLTPEQYQVYIDFLQTDQVRRATSAPKPDRNFSVTFFAISVLRKLCNHPDLLLLNADKDLQPPDMWNFERSGKMKVLSEIMKLWYSDGHRALIFVQTIQMLEVIQNWMCQMNYAHLRIDGKTPVKRRLKLIEEFNGNAEFFAMILTTRVGGVGLNIIGADRVVIFDPDWNPMTDVQARERTWRIGQRRDVAVYRLVLTGSIEEKVYQRQVYKHFLSQKVLNDPRQRQFFKWNDLADLFDMPPMPPNFNPDDMRALKDKYKELFKKFNRANGTDEHQAGEVETTEIMQAISELPTSSQNVASKEAAEEHNTILQTLYDSQGIKASFNHDKVEQPLLDRKIVRDGASMIAQRALAALQKSSRERASHHISEPTWTGQRGAAGATVKREKKPEGLGAGAPGMSVNTECLSARSGVSSADILSGLKQLAALRAMADSRHSTQAARGSLVAGGDKSVKAEQAPEAGQALPASDVGLPTELHATDRKIAEMILTAFLNKKLAGQQCSLTTGQVLQHLAGAVAAHHNDLFKSLLKQMCELSKPRHAGQPGIWTLRREFWPEGR